MNIGYSVFFVMVLSNMTWVSGKPQSSLVILSGWCWNNGRKMLLVLRKCWKVACLFKISRSRASQSKRWTVHKKISNPLVRIAKLMRMIHMGEENKVRKGVKITESAAWLQWSFDRGSLLQYFGNERYLNIVSCSLDFHFHFLCEN